MNESKESELKTAREYGGRRQPGSGNKRFPGLRGDVRVPRELRIEQKDPRTRKYVLKARDLDSLWVLARQASEMPVFLIVTRRWNDFVIIDYEDLRERERDCTKKGLILLKIDVVTMRKQKTLYLDDLDNKLYDDIMMAYIEIRTPERVYALMYRHLFDLIWRS